MNILQQPDSFSFSSGVKDIIIQTTQNVTAIYKYDEFTFLEEIYTPDVDGYIILRDLGDLVFPYLQEDSLERNFTITLSESESGETSLVGFKVLYCMTEIMGDISEFLSGNFLTLLDGEKYIYASGTEFLSIYATEASECTVLANYMDGSSSTKTIAFPSALGISTIEISPSKLFDNPELILTLIVSSGTRMMTYYVLPTLPEEYAQLLFVNSFGINETFIPSGLRSRENKYETEFGTFSGIYRKFKNKLTKEYTANTGILPESMARWIEDIFLSKDVSILELDGTKKGLVITEVKAVRTNAFDELPAFEFKYRLSKTNHSEFEPERDERIFDYTFDSTFN